MIRHLLGIGWHLAGTFLTPFLLAFVAALFFEVSEVAETLPWLMAVSAALLVPAFLAQLAGLLLKVAREGRELRRRGQLDTLALLETIHRHVAIVTPRGQAVFLSGLFFVVCAMGMKWASLSVLGVLALLLFYGVVGIASFISTFLVGSFQAGLRRRGAIERAAVPAVVLQGEPAEERFTFRRVPVPPGFTVLVEDPLPARLATTSRYAVGAGAQRDELVVGGRLRRTPRGLYKLGPARVYYQDLLGLTRITLASLATTELKVLPRFRALDIREPPRSRVDSPDLLARPHRLPTEDPFRFREYVAGDDTRRIAWKLSVRTGHLQVRVPETKETSARTVLLVLDTFLPRGRMLADAVGIEEVLDRMVETFLALAKELVDRGDRVAMVAVAREQGTGRLRIESLPCARGGQARWQDLGARASWQGQHDIGELLGASGAGTHGVIVSSRFQAPPPDLGDNAGLTWVYLPPQEALGPKDPPLLHVLAGTPVNAFLWLFRLPHPAGADENALGAQVRAVLRESGRLGARARLRAVAQANGARVLQALVTRGDAVYRLEPGVTTHRLVGLSAGRASGVAA